MNTTTPQQPLTTQGGPMVQQQNPQVAVPQGKGGALAPQNKKGGGLASPAGVSVNGPGRRAPVGNPLNSQEVALPKSSFMIWVVGLGLAAFGFWAYHFEIEEVSTGTGKVVGTVKEQIIQSLEGGVVAKLLVKEGDTVKAGQILAQLDPTRGESSVEESASRVRALKATAARLQAEVSQSPLVFPTEIQKEAELVRAETALYKSRRNSLEQSVAGMTETMSLLSSELKMTEPLVARGAASNVEVLRLKRQVADLQTRISDTETQYLVKAREELARTNADLEAQESVVRGRADSLSRMTLTAPMRGVVKELAINTVGGVIPPNGKLMEIVPLDDNMQIEARIQPRDIAYIHKDQDATVKLTAYDYSIYGGLKGKVNYISPDTIQDDVKRDQYYYRVYIKTAGESIKNKNGEPMPIVPGMIASVDIHTGSKTIWSYLIKPVNKANEALRER